MAKSDLDHAQQLLEMAAKDHRALANMLAYDDAEQRLHRESVIAKTAALLGHVRGIIS
jgi:hypothetical protein